MTFASTGNTFFMDFTNTNFVPMFVRGFKSFNSLAVSCCGGGPFAEGNSMWSRPGTAKEMKLALLVGLSTVKLSTTYQLMVRLFT